MSVGVKVNIKTQITTNEKGKIITDPTDIKNIIREYYKLFANKLIDFNKIDEFFEKHPMPSLAEDAIKNLNSLNSTEYIVFVIKETSHQENSRSKWCHW